MLELARRVISVDAYAVWRRDPVTAEWRTVVTEGLSAEFASSPVSSGRTMPDEPLVAENVEQHPALQDRAAVYRREGIRSLMAVPLRVHTENSGTLVFYSRRRRRFTKSERHAAEALANLGAASLAAAELFAAEARLRQDAQLAERRAAFLADATQLVASSLDYETTLAEVARLAVRQSGLADWCAVHLLEGDHQVRLLVAAGPGDGGFPSDPFSLPPTALGLQDALTAGQASLLQELEGRSNLGLGSAVCVPMQARGRVLGALSLVASRSGRQLDSADLAMAQHLGRRAGLAVENARLYHTARESEARFRCLFDSGVLAISLGRGETILEANDVFLALTGYSREDLRDGRLSRSALTPPESGAADAAADRELLERGASSPYEKEYLRKDGLRVPVYVTKALLEKGSEPVWISVALDLTERKRLEEQFREAQKLESIGLLAGGIAHDFNNLLTGILGSASLALDDIPVASPTRALLDNVVRSADRAAHLTRQLLAYSGRGRVIIEPVELSALVRDISSLLLMSIPKKVTLKLDLASGLPSVEADSSQLQQLVMNLVLNGAEAIGDHSGTLRVTTSLVRVDGSYRPGLLSGSPPSPGEYLSLEVQDDGMGMDEATRVRIFEPFFTTKSQGRGLGLAAALGIVRGHKGDLHVESRPGAGSTFRVLLPAAAASAIGVPQHQAQSVRGSGTILIADDEPVVLEAARAALERLGYQVLSAADGAEAVECFEQAAGSVALVILDLTMPVLSGQEALERILAIRPDARVIISTGHSESEAAKRFANAGVCGFIQKPYTSQMLGAAVASALNAPRRGLAAGT